MTEKPQAVVTDLTDFALDMHADCCGCVRKEATHTARFVVWLAKIEAQAKREGAREALDAIKVHGIPLIDQLAGSAASVAAGNMTICPSCYGEKERCTEADRCEHHRIQAEMRSNFTHIFELAIRALAAEPEVKPVGADAPSVCGLCGKPMPPGEEMFKYHGYSGPCPEPPQAPSKAEELPLGHEFWKGQSKHDC